MENSNASSASSKIITDTDEITSTAGAAASTNSSNINPALRSLNKSSYKISKPPSSSKILNPIPNPSPISNPTNPNPNPNPNPQPQPPVFNVDKSNFRELVQKLIGSPAASHPPPPPPPATSSRLHRIRPPSLSSVGPTAPPPPESWGRPALSPLPPLPFVSAAAESPSNLEKERFYREVASTAETGWDFSSHWMRKVIINNDTISTCNIQPKVLTDVQGHFHSCTHAKLKGQNKVDTIET